MAPKKQEYETLNSKLLAEEKYIAREVVNNTDMPEGLTKILLEYAKGKYSSMMILPSSIALRGSKWQPVTPFHIVYVKYSKKEQKRQESDIHNKEFYIIQPLVKNIKTKEEHHIPIHSL